MQSSEVSESNARGFNAALCRKYFNELVAAEVNTLTRYYDALFHYRPVAGDHNFATDFLDNTNKQVVQDLPDLTGESKTRSVVFLKGNLNHDKEYDIEAMLGAIRKKLSRSARVVLVLYNPYIRGLYWLANKLGIREGEYPSTFLTQVDLENLAKLAGFELVRSKPSGFFPFRLYGVGDLLNRVCAAIPFIRKMSFAYVAVLRPIHVQTEKPSLTILVPARDERGNIESAITRLPDFGGARVELIFVEGHSSDGTWEEIQRVQEKYADKYSIKSFQQTGRGKADAVRLGFSHATCDLLTILDADLTMPPELLTRFYDAYCRGDADVINGSRLVYPMEGEAMRFLNKLGNVFFAKALSSVLDVRIGDSLCGTKLVSRSDYDRFIRWRKDFGDFDPFGDFELIFPAAILGLGIIDIPIRYRDRTYGSTSISRFRNGFELLRMTTIGLLRIRMGQTNANR